MSNQERKSSENLNEDIVELDSRIIRACISLLKMYDPQMPVQDFLEEILLKFRIIEEDLEIILIKIFYHIIDMNKFLDFMFERFKLLFKRPKNIENESLLKVIIYLIIFKLKNNTKSIILERLKELSFEDSLFVARFLINTESFSTVAQSGCRVFDIEFVKQQILEPFNEKHSLIMELYKTLNNENKKNIAKILPKTTKAITPELMKREKSEEPHCHPPTPEGYIPFQANSIPLTTYLNVENNQKIQTNKKIDKQYTSPKVQINKSEKFFQTINDIKMEREAQFEKPKFKKYSLIGKNPKVKVNTTTILRKGARIKQKEEEIKRKIEDISTGGHDPDDLERLMVAAQSKQYEEEMEDIQLKHMKAQLMREQAAIAKKNVLLVNREKLLKYKEEKEEIDKMIEEWREAELVRIHERVEMANEIKLKAKEAQNLMIANNIKHAKDVTEESRLLMQEALRQRQEELERKVALMREIKAMESMKPLKIKEFDPTETSGLGLMCEMSIAELRERLMLLRVEWHEALCKKREAIKSEKERYQNLIESTQKMIEKNETQYINEKSSTVCLVKKSVSDSPKIQAMRRLLEERREQLQSLDKEVKAAGLIVSSSRTRNNI